MDYLQPMPELAASAVDRSGKRPLPGGGRAAAPSCNACPAEQKRTELSVNPENCAESLRTKEGDLSSAEAFCLLKCPFMNEEQNRNKEE